MTITRRCSRSTPSTHSEPTIHVLYDGTIGRLGHPQQRCGRIDFAYSSFRNTVIHAGPAPPPPPPQQQQQQPRSVPVPVTVTVTATSKKKLAYAWQGRLVAANLGRERSLGRGFTWHARRASRSIAHTCTHVQSRRSRRAFPTWAPVKQRYFSSSVGVAEPA